LGDQQPAFFIGVPMGQSTYSQANAPMELTTPLGPDALLLTGFTGREGISQLFQFQLDLLAENGRDIAFDKLLGQPVSIRLALGGGKNRYFHGIVSRLSQGMRDDNFTSFRAEVVPQFWLLTRRKQSRIFQHVSVPDILKKVLHGLDVAFELVGTYHPRDYCVQYRESDFAFASRLMEEEGIFYFFKHSADGHKMLVANSPPSHPDLPEKSKILFEDKSGATKARCRITGWEKLQELRSGKVTLWDHCFELPHKNLEAGRTIVDSVPVGQVSHKLKVGGNEQLEIYDYPGGYAQRFDGMDKGGGERSADLQKIYAENARAAVIRIQQEAVAGLLIQGTSYCRQMTSGYKFTLARHFNADGQYVLTSVEHRARQKWAFRSGEGTAFAYDNRFTCLPIALPYRPPPVTEKPVIQGTQTAVVVGPPGEAIFCDKYGRVKVQFHWDRQGKKDVDSSCWVRVSQNWGGSNWGGMFLPHVGQEVIVSFEEGDPDQPIITGRVYNAEMMPPLKLPDNKAKSVIQDHGGNQIMMDGASKRICIYSPYSKTTLSMGAPNSPVAGFYFGTETDMTYRIQGLKDEEILKNQRQYVKGTSESVVDGTSTSVYGSDYTQKVKGAEQYWTEGRYQMDVRGPYQDFYHGTYETTVIGSQTTLNLINVNEVIVGLSASLSVGAKIEIDATKDVIKTPLIQRLVAAVSKRIGKITEKVINWNKTIAKVVEKIGEYTQEVEGTMDSKVLGAYTLKAKPISMESDGDMDIKAPILHIDGNVSITKNLVVDGRSIELKGDCKLG
jgi:type VI secretion system secreted protein VgrG